MDLDTWLNLALVLVFILVGGVFAATEIALVSLRSSQLDRMAQDSARGARVAAVARDPNRFLAAVQIGVTVAGFFSAAYGASSLAPDFAPYLEDLGLSEGLARTLTLVLLTLFIAYLSLVLGELAPKRIALQRTARVALAVGPPLDRFATFMRPVVWFLSVSTNAVVRLLGANPAARSEGITEEELRDLVIAHESLPADERRILDDVFTSAGRRLAEVMRPRGEVVFLAADLGIDDAIRTVRDQPYSRYPVIGESFDDVLGFLHIRDLLDPSPAAATVRDMMRDIVALPASNHLLPALSLLRRDGVHIAVVIDEYGGTDGIVTLEDLVEELVGDIRDEYDTESAPGPTTTRDGATTVDGGITIEEFAEQTGVELADGPYETVAGYVIARLGRLAEVGDVVTVGHRRLVVAAVENRRVTRVELAAPGPAGGV